MEKMEIIKCGRCGTDFPFSARAIKYRRKIDPATKFYCSKECRCAPQIMTISCEYCGKTFTKKLCEYLRNKNHFCSKSCSAKKSNKTRSYKCEKGKQKFFTCSACGVTSILSAYRVSVCRNKFCEKYAPIFKEKRQSVRKRSLQCIKCGVSFIAQDAKYCNLCRAVRQKEIGNKSVLSQNRRSKNEIYFAELCEKQFGKIKTNEPQFNNWDADIILDDFKIAILWNGNWHYQEISKCVSLAQVQARDKIKVKEIIKCGYYPYIIEDRGRYNKKFVEEQFKIFLEYLCSDFVI